MSRSVTIALDAMGGDAGPAVCVPAAVALLRERSDFRLTLVGREAELTPYLDGVDGAVRDRVDIRNASEVVGMDEPPGDALRRKKDSSMRVAIDLVKQGDADACVSAGNTGALMATGRFVLKTLPGIDRPAIMAAVPGRGHRSYILDLGANAQCSARQLQQFAVMGSVVASQMDNIDQPRIGLLNIGAEDIKGNDIVRDAAALISDSPLNYVGFVEGNELFSNRADVIVCDGFTGNVALKAIEGTAVLVRDILSEQFRETFFGRLAALMCMPVLRKVGHRLDHRRYNGASLVGLDGIVVKSHGGADQVAFQHAIITAISEAGTGVPDKIRRLLEESAE